MTDYHQIPDGYSQPDGKTALYHYLHYAGLDEWEDVAALSPDRLLRLSGIGETRLRQIVSILSDLGIEYPYELPPERPRCPHCGAILRGPRRAA